MSSGLTGRAMRALALLLGCLLMCTFAIAQSTTDGAIGGTVFDKAGAVVGGAKITVHNNGTNAEQTVNTDASGNYRVTGLQPGDYTVSVSAGSMAPYKAEHVIVQVGSITEISPHLGVQGGNEVVDVTAEAPQINYTSPDFANTLNDTAVSNLPINGGRWSSFAILTPTVVSNTSGFGLLSFRGISVLLNNNTVDGADNNQAFFSEERGRTRVGYSTPMGAVQEFQVNTSNYSSEYGRSAGGVVNTVTKSGTNQLHGEGYFFDRDNVWGAANPFTTIAVQNPATGVFSSVNFKPTDWRKRAGFTVGGPLLKDRLFWIVSYDWYKRNFPGTAVSSNPNVFFAQPTCIGTAAWQPGNLCDATSQVGALAKNLYGNAGNTVANDATIGNPVGGLWANGLAGLNSMLGPIARTGEQNITYPKLDWVINSKNHASFAVNRMRWTSPAGIQTQATNTFASNSFGNDFVQDTWGVAKLDTIFTSNFANQLRFQYGRDFEFEFAQQPTAYETANMVNCGTCNGGGYVNPLGLPPQVSLTNGFTFGVPTFLQRPRFPDEVRAQYADTMTWTHGNHTLKWGADISHVDDLSVNLRTQYGSYSYNNLGAYFSDFYCSQEAHFSVTCPNGTRFYTSNFQQAFGPLGFEFNTMDYAFFGQDDWKVFPRLTLSFGLRYEYEALPGPINGGALVNPAVPQTGSLPHDKNNFGPRVGFSVGLTGDGKTVLRGGYGIYYGRIINSAIYNALTNTGLPTGQATVSLNTATGPTFPQILPPTTPTLTRPNIVFFDPHFQAPQIQQYDLVIERDLGWGTVVSASYLGSLGRELPGFGDTNICVNAVQPGCSGAAGFGLPPSTITYNTSGGPLGSSTLTEPLFRSRPTLPVGTCLPGTAGYPNCALGAMTDIFSGINSRYDAFVLQLNHRFSHHVQFNFNYTRSRSLDFNQNESTFTDTNDPLLPIGAPGAMAQEKARGIYDMPYRVVLSAVATSPWKVSGWASYFANDWEIAPIYQIQDGLPYTLRTTGSAPGGANGSINGSGGDNRIDAIGRNTFRFPGTWVTDLRISKSLPIRERVKVELLADFFNLANKQNITSINTTGYAIGNNATTCGATPTPCLAFQSATFGTITNVNSNFAYSPRQIQLGARVKF